MRKIDKIFNSMIGCISLPKNDYISDGLVFQIDGILNKSRIPQPIVAQWQGSTKYFAEYRGTVARNSTNNGWYFDGETCLQAQGNLVPVNYATSTIEIVFKDYNGFSKNSFLFGNGRSDDDNIIAATDTAHKFVYTSVVNPAYEMQPTTDIVAVSASSVIGMSNGESLTASGSHSFNRWGVVSIGGRPNSATLDLYGEIYAIRVYNRQLTKSEVIHNQLLDCMRFGIGALYAVQAFDALQENYNPEFVTFLNDLLYNDTNKDRYMIAEAEAVTKLTRNPFKNVPDINSYNVKTLDELRYFNGLTKLPSRMCAAVSSVIYPDSITIVGDQAWLSRPMLKYFEIGNAVTKIQGYLFQTSTAPTTYVCRTPTPPAYDATGYSKKQRAVCDLFVPAESITLYQQASVWNEFKSINAIDPSKKKQSL